MEFKLKDKNTSTHQEHILSADDGRYASCANWILGRNFGASAGAKRRGPGGEINSRGSV